MTMSNNAVARNFNSSPMVTWALLVSVTLNLFLTGALASVMCADRHKPFGPMALAAPHGEYTVDWMARHLDQQDAGVFREAFQAHAEALKRDHARLHQAMTDVATAFEQDPQDAAALQSALDRLNQAKVDVDGEVGKIAQDSYGKLSPDGRRRLAELAQ